jgi:hypothetical protein
VLIAFLLFLGIEVTKDKEMAGVGIALMLFVAILFCFIGLVAGILGSVMKVGSRTGSKKEALSSPQIANIQSQGRDKAGVLVPHDVPQRGYETREGFPPQLQYPSIVNKPNSNIKGCLLAFMIISVLVILTFVGAFAWIRASTLKSLRTKTVEIAVGQAGRSGDVLVKVIEWNASNGDAANIPKAGEEFIIVEVQVKNIGSRAERVFIRSEMDLKSEDPKPYLSSRYVPDPIFPDGDIGPGQTVQGNVAFRVPLNAKRLFFTYGRFQTTVRVKLR